jgi:hypothetical protein
MWRTVEGNHRPPRAVGIASAFRASAIAWRAIPAAASAAIRARTSAGKIGQVSRQCWRQPRSRSHASTSSAMGVGGSTGLAVAGGAPSSGANIRRASLRSNHAEAASTKGMITAQPATNPASTPIRANRDRGAVPAPRAKPVVRS